MQNAQDGSLMHQVNRIRGQVDGIGRMIEEKRDCLEVIQQILAARNALSRLGKEFLTSEASRCTLPSDKRQFDDMLKQLFLL